MDVTPFAKIGPEAWDAFCDRSPDAWAWHTSAGLRLGRSFTEGAENLSFGLQKDGTLIAVVPLILERGASGEAECAMGGTAIPFPACSPALDEEEKKEVLDSIFAEIDRVARERGVSRAIFSVDPMAPSAASLREHPLLRYGFKDTSIETSVIDLAQSEEELLARMSKGHRGDILFAQKSAYRADIVESSPTACEEFKKLYFAAAGKEIGTPERWRSIEQLFAEKKLLFVFGEGSAVAALVYKRRAYYMLSGTLPAVRAERRGLGSHLQWALIRHLRQHNYTQYELGWQEAASPKEEAIAAYKRHFGGEAVPLRRGAKYYR